MLILNLHYYQETLKKSLKYFRQIFLNKKLKKYLFGYLQKIYLLPPFSKFFFENFFLNRINDSLKDRVWAVDVVETLAKRWRAVKLFTEIRFDLQIKTYTLMLITHCLVVLYFLNKGHQISRKEYPIGFFFFAFDLKSDLSSNTLTHWNLICHGSLRLVLRFSEVSIMC